MRAALLATLIVATGCGATGVRPFEYPLLANGSVATPITIGDYNVTLTRAELTFGPAYFCPTAAASPDLCPIAQAEYTDAELINLLDGNAQSLGAIDALAGRIRTVTYDLGYSWFPTDTTPRVAVHAAGCDTANGCTSAYFEATVTNTTTNATSTLAVPIAIEPIFAGVRVVGATSVDATVTNAHEQLTISANANTWWSALEPRHLDGVVGVGVGDAVAPADSKLIDALRLQITVGAPLQFTWEATSP